MNNEGTRVLTTLYTYILDAQVHVWLGVAKNQTHSLVSLLPARKRKIHSKIKVLECSQFTELPLQEYADFL